MSSQYVPTLKENSVLVKNGDKYILKSCSLEDNFIEVNSNAQIIISEIEKKKPIENVYDFILGQSNIKEKEVIKKQVDLFLFQLHCLREYLEDDETGYLQKEFLTTNFCTIDPFGAYTKNEIINNSLKCRFKNFYYNSNSFSEDLFYSSFTANKMFALVDKGSSSTTVMILKHLEDLINFELIAIFSTKDFNESYIFTKMFDSINIYSNLFYKKSLNKYSKIIIKSDSHIYEHSNYHAVKCGVLKHENATKDCFISLLDLYGKGAKANV